ncbi:MAG: 16S rRNA processing protein RimM [Proteobacteria bacterium]|jgi:16S rRNA processing protein RimM|nr:16S rRNA processing protein RimM [Pseudomonadota bacterium]
MATEPKSSPFPTLKGEGFLDDEIELGYVSGVFGVRGEVRLFLHHLSSVLLEGQWSVVLLDLTGRRHSASCSARRGTNKRIIGRWTGVTDREVASSLRGWRIGVAKEKLPSLEAGEFYIYQLVGLPVFVGEEVVGEVVAVHPVPQHDLLEVKVGAEVEFVPCTRQFVKELDLEGGRVVLLEAAWDS